MICGFESHRLLWYAGVAKSGKAGGFQPSMRGFDSHYPLKRWVKLPLLTYYCMSRIAFRIDWRACSTSITVNAAALYVVESWFESKVEYYEWTMENLEIRYHSQRGWYKRNYSYLALVCIGETGQSWEIWNYYS